MTDWLQPTPVDDVQIAFPADALDRMPAWEEIPDEFKRRGNDWVKFAEYMFSAGLSGDVKFFMKEGVDGNTAFRHLRSIMGSYAPKHEHKIAAVAWLASLWCNAITDYEHEKEEADV